MVKLLAENVEQSYPILYLISVILLLALWKSFVWNWNGHITLEFMWDSFVLSNRFDILSSCKMFVFLIRRTTMVVSTSIRSATITNLLKPYILKMHFTKYDSYMPQRPPWPHLQVPRKKLWGLPWNVLWMLEQPPRLMNSYWKAFSKGYSCSHYFNKGWTEISR